MMKKMISFFCIALLALSLAACGEAKDNTVTEPSNVESSVALADESETLDLASADLSNPSVVVELNDADGMDALTSDLVNMRIEEGTVVKVTGAASTTNSTCLMAAREDGSKIGVQINVDGEWQAPQNGTILEATGVVVKGQYSMEFHVLPENVVTVSE